MEGMYKQKIIEFIITFLQNIDNDIKDMKLQMSARARAVARKLLTEFP